MATDLQTELLHDDDNDNIGIKLSVIESMLLQCTVLVKQSTSTNVIHEDFVKATYNYATDLVTCSSELKELCSQRINQLDKGHDHISLIEPMNRAFMERDPGKLSQNLRSYQFIDSCIFR